MRRLLALVFLAMSLAGAAAAAEKFDAALAKAAEDYAARLKQAGDELNRVRARIAAEKAPITTEMRATEDRIIALERELVRLTTDQENAAANKRRLLREIEEQRKTGAYITTLAGDALKVQQNALAPGEARLVGETLAKLETAIDAATASGSGSGAALDVADFMLTRTERQLGGTLVAGQALNADNSILQDGTFAFTGPEVFFQPKGGGPAGVVRMREGSTQPAFFPQPTWSPAESAAFFGGQLGAMPADPTGGKALRLQQTSGTLLQHISKGGKVAYAIVLVGFVALLLIVLKIADVAAMRVDTSPRPAAFLTALASNGPAAAAAALPKLAPTTRELFAAGLAHAEAPSAILEEKLEAVLLGQQLRFERRLPLLAVIATAAPLMGLLGTVVGMVKTFTLITVFGTGNAAKLSSGISEVLVATELGLAVAIPTLVIHGFLAHRIAKNMALLERQALEFVTTAAAARNPLVSEGEVR